LTSAFTKHALGWFGCHESDGSGLAHRTSFKRSLSRPGVAVTVFEYDAANPNASPTEHAAGRRYRALFGDGMDWHACGLDGWLARQ
jgi:hypothetical protein